MKGYKQTEGVNKEKHNINSNIRAVKGKNHAVTLAQLHKHNDANSRSTQAREKDCQNN